MPHGPFLIRLLGRLNTFHYVLMCVVGSIVIVSAFSIYFHGKVTADYLVTGIATALIVSYVIVGILKIHQHILELEIVRRQEAEAEKNRLIETLDKALAVEQELAELKEKERERLASIKDEKLKTMQQAMCKVMHYVNNLANNLLLIEIEYRERGNISEDTLAELDHAIRESAEEMQVMARISDPFEEEPFRIRF